MAFINAGRHLSTVGSAGAAVLMDLQIKIQGNIPGPGGVNPSQFPYRGQPGTPQEIERTLTSLPDFQIGETVTGSANSYTSVYIGVSLAGTTELANSVGGGAGGAGEICGWGGGSGGGGATNNWGSTAGGISVAGQGNNGGTGGDRQGSGGGASGGGGGASAAGGGGQSGGSTAGPGGAGANNAFRTGSNIIYAGGGGGAGGGTSPTSAAGGTGGGGTGASGAANLGGGGGTGASVSNGGSGIVVVRYDTSQSGFSLSGGTTDTYTIGAVNYQSNTFLTSSALVVTGTGDIDSMIISGGGGAGSHGGSAEGGFYKGGGGAGGMHVATNTEIVAGTYAIAVGAGGTGSAVTAARTGNLSWITPRRTISVSEPTGAYVTGETLTGGTSGATGDVIVYTP
jgi:hypothetical protein